jgi:hypothetical protein
MSDEKEKRGIVDTSDCLEAVDVFRGWKNFLFVIVLIALLHLQASFWLMDLGYVKIDETAAESATMEKGQNAALAAQPAAEPNKPVAISEAAAKPGFQIGFKQLTWLIRFFNFILIPAAVFYCLTLLFGLQVSLVGRLGGVSHVTRAFFLSLLMLILMLPWQKIFWGVVVGMMYSPDDLLNSVTITPANDMLASILYYTRFTIYWAIVVLLLIFAQLRSSKWARAMLRRLEVV